MTPQTTAAATAGLTDETLSRLERGVQVASVETLVQLAEAYDTDPSELLGFASRPGRAVSPKSATINQIVGLLRAQPADRVELSLNILRVLFGAVAPRGSRSRR